MIARALLFFALPLFATSVFASDGRYVMGTVLEISAAESVDLEPLFARATSLDRMLTRFDPESPLSRMNAGQQRVPPELAALLAESVRYTELTLGAFDVTVGPLVALWWQAAARGTPPSDAELDLARSRVGAHQIRVQGDRAEIGQANVDLGGIAKGYALDTLAHELRTHGVNDALLSFGQSSIAALGRPPSVRGRSRGRGWRLLLRSPTGGFAGTVELVDQHLSVSDSLGQSLVIDGRAYGHVIDPRSGRPLERRAVAAVTASSGARAEALSKALLVLEPDEALALIASLPDAEALLQVEGEAPRATSGWRYEPLPYAMR